MLIFLDIETTGIEQNDKVCSIGMILLDDKNNITTNYELINEHKKINSKASSINHITNEMLKDKPSFQDSLSINILEKNNNNSTTIVGHNINFTLNILKNSGFIFKGDTIDTMRISKHLIEDSESYSLQFLRYDLKLYKDDDKNLKESNLDIKLTAHNAISDALVVKELYEYHLQTENKKMLSMLSNQPVLMKKLPFGKYQGSYIEEIYNTNRAYLEWMLNTIVDIDEDLRYSIEYYLKGEI